MWWMQPTTADDARAHGLAADDYRKILEVLGRAPNGVELGILSVMWSEHCCYKSSKFHLRRLPTRGACVIEGPGENAGVIDIGEGLAAVFKIESHNHPSFIEPFQGAATGVGGIMRDIFTMGARPIANLNSLHFGATDHPRTAFLLEGVVAGIGNYGNCMGVPTVGGEIEFHPCYNGNILVNAFTLGLVDRTKIFRAKASGVGNPVIYLGSKTGRDGIHGATMASAAFDEGSEDRRPTVQVGDPFTEKLLLEACMELMATDAVVAIQDMGAAGLTCSTFEMAAKGACGMRVHLNAVPTRESGMNPYEMMLSESQERMLLVARKGTEDRVRVIAEKWELDMAIVGEIVTGDRVEVYFNQRKVADLPVALVVDGTPELQRPQTPAPSPPRCRARVDGRDLQQDFFKLLGDPTIGDASWVWQQYDHTVQTNTVFGPGGDAALIRIQGTDRALAVSVDSNSSWSQLDPFLGAQLTVAESGRNLVCTGATPLALTNCLNFGNPEHPIVMWQLSQTIDGMAAACDVFKTPVISGNVSLYNETLGTDIYPTPTIAMVGLLNRLNDRVPSSFQNDGDRIWLLGPEANSLAASHYARCCLGDDGGPCPSIDLQLEYRLWQLMIQAAQEKLFASAHDVSRGGLVVAIAESCVTGRRLVGFQSGFHLDGKTDVASTLFGEGASRIVVSVSGEKELRLKALLSAYQLPGRYLGVAHGERLTIGPVDLTLQEVQAARRGSVQRVVAHNRP